MHSVPPPSPGRSDGRSVGPSGRRWRLALGPPPPRPSLASEELHDSAGASSLGLISLVGQSSEARRFLRQGRTKWNAQVSGRQWIRKLRRLEQNWNLRAVREHAVDVLRLWPAWLRAEGIAHEARWWCRTELLILLCRDGRTVARAKERCWLVVSLFEISFLGLWGRCVRGERRRSAPVSQFYLLNELMSSKIFL